MKVLLQIIFLVLTLTSCIEPTTDTYKDLVDRTTRIEIEFNNSNDVIELDEDELEIFKNNLKRNIKPKNQRKLTAKIKVNPF